MKALVVRLDHLGDLILTTPLVRALAKAGYSVDVVTTAYALPALTNNPRVNEQFAIEKIAPDFPLRWLAFARWIRSKKYNAIMLPHARPKELLFASLFSGARVRVAMWGGIWGRLTGHRALRSGIVKSPRHMSDIWLDCARAIGIAPAGFQPEIFLASDEQQEMENIFRRRFGAKRVIAIHPGSGGNTCNLPHGEYGRFASLILDQTDLGIVVTGTLNERRTYLGWDEKTLSSDRLWLSAGELTLRQLMALVAEVDLLVCVGTGPLHIASALETPTLSPFCPYVGVCAHVWGNLGGPAMVLEQPRSLCGKLNGREFCGFHGGVTAKSLFAAMQKCIA